MSPTKILCTGDIHLGHSSTGFAERRGVAPVWTEVVPDLARREGVELVVLTGDVLEHANRAFEAYGVLRDGLQRLLDAGVDVVAVAGNHDHDVLPQLADALSHERFWLLGRNATWQRRGWPNEDTPRLYLEGWSFPEARARYDRDPVGEFDLESPPRDDVPRLGIVHGDLAAPGAASPYAPLNLHALAAHGADAWLLGHIHKPGLRHDDPPVLYPGSPQAMDPSESGAHGPWLIEVAGRGRVDCRQLVASPVRYEVLEVDISDCHDIPAVIAATERAARALVDDVAAAATLPPQALSLRVTYTGRSPAAASVRDQADGLALAGFRSGGVAVHFDGRPRCVARAPFDLARAAGDDNPLGQLARRLQTVESGEAEAWLEELRRQLTETVWAASAFRDLDDRGAGPDAALVEAVVAEAGAGLLDALAAQVVDAEGDR